MRLRLTLLAVLCVLCAFALSGDARVDQMRVTVTAYSPSDSGRITASGKRAQPGMLALSRDVERDMQLRFGDKVRLEGLGTFVVEDRMARRWKRRVDVRVLTHREARSFGRQTAILRRLAPAL
jgi:3D (Asp-Asp-Asp) domain-containing protein